MKNYLELRKEELRKRGNKGFTLMEMLIVVAIIAVLIAIAIPVFTGQLEKSREATDAANIRSEYAEITAEYLTQDTPAAISTGHVVNLKQAEDDWQSSISLPDVLSITGVPKNGGTATLACDAEGVVTCTFSS